MSGYTIPESVYDEWEWWSPSNTTEQEASTRYYIDRREFWARQLMLWPDDPASPYRHTESKSAQ